MKDGFELIWSDEALKGLKSILDYFENHFSENDIRNFVRRLDRSVEIIRQKPEIFIESKKGYSTRRVVVTRFTTLFYRINGNVVEVVAIIDSRQQQPYS